MKSWNRDRFHHFKISYRFHEIANMCEFLICVDFLLARGLLYLSSFPLRISQLVCRPSTRRKRLTTIMDPVKVVPKSRSRRRFRVSRFMLRRRRRTWPIQKVSQRPDKKRRETRWKYESFHAYKIGNQPWEGYQNSFHGCMYTPGFIGYVTRFPTHQDFNPTYVRRSHDWRWLLLYSYTRCSTRDVV